MNSFKTFLQALKLDKLYWQTFLIDLICFGLIFLAFSGFGTYLQSQSEVLMGGKSVEQMQELIATASPEQLLPFTQALQSYLLTFLIGGLILVAGSWLFYSYCTALIWNHLLHKKITKKTYWRWNALNLALILPLLAYALVALIVKVIFAALLKFLFTFSATFYVRFESALISISTVLNGLFGFVLILIAVVWVFFAYYSFIEKYKVWYSIGDAFTLFRSNWSKLWRGMLWILGVGAILALILTGVKWLYLPIWINSIVQFILSLLYYAWMRKYVLLMVHVQKA